MTIAHRNGAWWFLVGDDWRTLSDPDGLPTGPQLVRLAKEGLLEIRPSRGPKLTKLEAARAIDLSTTGWRTT